MQLENLTFEDLDYTGYALKLQEDPNFEPSPDEFKSIEDVQELFWVSGMSVEGFKMKAGGVTAFIDHHAIRDISDSGIGAFEINDVSVTSPGMAFSIDSVDIQNLKVPMGSDAAMEDIFTTADKFEINRIQFSMDGFGAYAVEQIYIRESDHATLQNGMRLPTKTETGIVGLTLPTTLFASSPEIYPFFTINEMENLVIDMTGTGTIDLETGEAGSKSTLRLRELAALSMGMKMGGLTGALFDEFAETIEQSLAAEMPALDLTADEITDFLRALTDPILKGTSPEGYELPELPPMPELEAFLDGAIKDVALTGGSIEYEDLSLFSKLNAYFVGTGMSPDEANLMLSQTVAMLAITAVGIPVAEETATGLYMMTESPGSFVVEFDITPPVSFGEVMELTESDEAMNTFLMTDWSERIQSTLVVKDSEGNEVDLATGD